MNNYKQIKELYCSYIGSENELFHYGVKGMKWGVRNEYGELTNKGKKLYYDELLYGKEKVSSISSQEKSYEQDLIKQKKYGETYRDAQLLIGSYMKDYIRTNESIIKCNKKLEKLDSDLRNEKLDPNYKVYYDYDRSSFEGGGMELYREKLKQIYLRHLQDKNVRDALELMPKLYSRKKACIMHIVECLGDETPSSYTYDFSKITKLLSNGEQKSGVASLLSKNGLTFSQGLAGEDYLDYLDEYYRLTPVKNAYKLNKA